MKPIVCVMAAAFALAGSAGLLQAADWEGVYTGTLGKAKILVQLVEPVEDAEGETKRDTSRYSYLPKTRDLNLALTGADGTLRFNETPMLFYEFAAAPPQEQKITGHWELTAKGDQIKGTWTSPKKDKRLPISLTRVQLLSDEESDPDLNILDDTYNATWLKTVTFADAGPSQRFGEVEVRWVKDSAFGTNYPVLGEFPDAERKAKVNDVLLAAHRKSVRNYRDCKNGVSADLPDATAAGEFGYTISYASPQILSFSESGSVFCGGAHPSNYTTPITYDLTTGEKIGGDYGLDVSPEGFGRVLKLGTKEDRIAFERFAMERWMAGAAADPEMGPDCSSGWMEESPEGERLFSLSFTPKGLAILRTDFPHVASVCLFTDFNPTVIPWADLKPYLRDGQSLLTNEVQ